MPASRPAPPGRLSVTPGDGRRYVWERGARWITVERFHYAGTALTFVDTGDRIPAPQSRTVTTFMAAVDGYRAQLTA